MDLDSAFQKHGEWVERFCTAIFNQGVVDAPSYANEHGCELGIWLYGEGKAQYGKLNAFTNLVSRHVAFHKVAGSVAEAINAKDFEQAENLLGKNGGYAVASNSVHQAILKLKEEANL